MRRDLGVKPGHKVAIGWVIYMYICPYLQVKTHFLLSIPCLPMDQIWPNMQHTWFIYTEWISHDKCCTRLLIAWRGIAEPSLLSTPYVLARWDHLVLSIWAGLYNSLSPEGPIYQWDIWQTVIEDQLLLSLCCIYSHIVHLWPGCSSWCPVFVCTNSNLSRITPPRKENCNLFY